MYMAAFYLCGGGHFGFVIMKIHLGVALIPGSQIYYEVFVATATADRIRCGRLRAGRD